MDKLNSKRNHPAEHLILLLRKAIEFGKAQLLQKTVVVAPIICFVVMLILFSSLILLFLFIGLAIWVTEKVNDVLLGLFFPAVIILCICAVISIFGESSIIPFFRNKMVNSLKEENQ